MTFVGVSVLSVGTMPSELPTKHTNHTKGIPLRNPKPESLHIDKIIDFAGC
jgi:hypothetical protein